MVNGRWGGGMEGAVAYDFQMEVSLSFCWSPPIQMHCPQPCWWNIHIPLSPLSLLMLKSLQPLSALLFFPLANHSPSFPLPPPWKGLLWKRKAPPSNLCRQSLLCFLLLKRMQESNQAHTMGNTQTVYWADLWLLVPAHCFWCVFPILCLLTFF